MRNHIRVAVAAIAVAFGLAGCDSIKPVPLTADSLTAYQGQPLTVVTYDPKAGYMQMTAGSAMFGAIGALAAVSESEKLVKQYDLTSPAIRTAEKLAPMLSDKLKLASVTPVSYVPEKNKPDPQLATLAGNKGLLIDVQATAWMTIYFPMNWSHYKAMYYGVSRVVDGTTGKVIAVAPCKVEPANDKDAPTYDELYANNASLLKSKYQDAADDCADQMAKALFPASAVTH